MRVSDAEIKKILQGQHAIVREIVELEEGIDDPEFEIDPKLVRQVARRVMQMPDRDDLVAELKARIERGEYNPTGDEIAEAMIRRAIADSVR